MSFPSLGDLPDPGIEPMSPVLEGRFFTSLASREDRDKTCLHVQFIVVFHFLSSVQLFVIPWTTAHEASLSFTISWTLLNLMSSESLMSSNHLILCCPLLLLPSIFPHIRVFSSESALRIRWPKYWSFNFRVILSSEHSGLISFRTDWLDLLAVQGTLKSLLQHHSLKEATFWYSAFFMVQLSHLTSIHDYWKNLQQDNFAAYLKLRTL